MRDLVILGAGSVVLYQASEIVQDSKVFVNNVFLCCSSVVCCQDMKLWATFSINLKIPTVVFPAAVVPSRNSTGVWHFKNALYFSDSTRSMLLIIRLR